MRSASPSDHGPVGYRWVVFGILALGYMLVFFHRMCPAVVALDLMKDLDAGPTLMGVLASAYFYPYALMQIPAGLLSDSWGPRKSVTVFFMLAGVASLLFGAAWSAASAVAARVLVGLGVALVFVPTTKILTRWFPYRQFAMMTGVLLATGGMGAYLSTQPLAWLSSTLGWRTSFMIIGGISLGVAVLIWTFVRDNPSDKGYPPPDPRRADPDSEAAIGLGQGLKTVLSSAKFYPLAAWFFFSGMVFFGLLGLWAGPYMMHVHSMSKTEAGGVLSLVALGMIIGSPLLAWVSDRLRSRKKVMVGTVALLALVLAPAAFDSAAVPLWGLYLGCLVITICCAASSALGFTAAKEMYPSRISGTAVGLVNIFPFLGGALSQPFLGLVLEHCSGDTCPVYSDEAYGRLFQLCLGAALLALLFVSFIKETYRESDG